MKLTQSAYRAVDRYARSRVADGDVYGWAEGREAKAAVLLVRRGVNLDSFPPTINGVRIQIREISEPQPATD